jgi:FkbM family methyltransferase
MKGKEVGWLIGALRAFPLTKRLARWWVRGKDIKIRAGAGEGMRFNSAHSNPAYSLGTNELPVQNALAEHLSSKDVFYDIGANVGFFTIVGAKLVGPYGKVISFEPVPENANVIRHNVQINQLQNVSVVEKAVSNHNDYESLQVTTYSGGAMLASAGTADDVARTIKIPVISIDHAITNSELPPPNVVKIDVEGAELNVFLGMVYTLRCYHPVLIYEIDDQTEEAFEQKRTSCEQFLMGFNYQITRLPDSYPQSGWKVAHFVATAHSEDTEGATSWHDR